MAKATTSSTGNARIAPCAIVNHTKSMWVKCGNFYYEGRGGLAKDKRHIGLRNRLNRGAILFSVCVGRNVFE